MHAKAPSTPRPAGGPGQRFVLEAVRAWATEQACPPPPDDVDWTTVAIEAGVFATVADALVTSGFELTPALRAARLASAATSMRAMVEVDALTDSLTSVRWAILKGPILADIVYRTRSSRTYDDLDVLVHPADLEQALDSLEATGYRLVDRNWPMIARMERGEISLTGRTGTNIDLHWHPINDRRIRGQFRVDVDDLLRRAQPVVLHDREVRSLAPADLVVYVALHAALSGGHQLRWLLDVQQAVRWSGCTPEEIGWRARVHGLGLVVRTMLDRASTYLDPALTPFRDEAARASAWTAMCRQVSRAEVPLVSLGHRSGRSVFAATRRSSLGSATQLVRDLVHDAQDRSNGRDAASEVAELLSVHDSPSHREAWLAAAAGRVDD